GLLGAVALAVPLAITFVFLLAKAQSERLARAGLGLTVTLALYSFGENLEILAYLYWPALVMIGITLKPASENAVS
ncbi:MAG: O-antigen ligase domain-containing protein, partial [Altererythrobacter sp.]|nr:O-antigen ligase domain-containing protein [Altererythrobacter sp.]